MSLKVTVLGSSGSYASADEPCSGYLVESDTTSIWVDCGPGTLAKLQEYIAPTELDALFVSHQHPDHSAELPVLYNALRWYLGSPTIDVYAARSVRPVTDIHVGDSSDVFIWHELNRHVPVTVGDITVTFDITDHSVETFAMRFECDGGSIVYTADTAAGWDVARFAADVDVLIGEGTVLDADADPDFPHLSCRQIAEFAERAGARCLMVTHLAPGSDPAEFAVEARLHTSAEVVVARTGLVVSATR